MAMPDDFTTSPAPLAPDAIHVWCAGPGPDAMNPDVRARCEAILSDEERARCRRFVFDVHRRQFLVAHALVRTTLSRYTGTPPARWTFETNEYGRPEIAGPAGGPPLRFNLSHTDGLVACAVTLARDVGVDVEYLDRRRPADLEIAQRYFAPAEVDALEGLPAAERLAAFFDFWTLKEAYIKARGMGLALPLRHFAFRLASASNPAIAFDPAIVDDPAGWHFELARPTPTHRLALAVRRPAGTTVRMELVWTDPDTIAAGVTGLLDRSA